MSKTATTRALSELVGGRLVGSPETVITGINRIEFSVPGEITFIAQRRYAHYAELTAASCIICSEELLETPPANRDIIYVDDPYRAHLKLLQFFSPHRAVEYGFRHSTAVVHPDALLADTVYLGPYTVIGPGCALDEYVAVHANATLYGKVQVGEHSTIHSGAVLGESTVLGKRCVIQPGAVLGGDGFGFYEHKDGRWEKIPQIGIVELEDDVEIGANATVDRASMGRTIIRKGVKIDNLVQVGHNVELGEHTAIASQAGISGSAKVGKRNRIAGQVGMVGHIHTADDVVIIAQSGVSKSIKEKGTYFGSPAVPMMERAKQIAAEQQLPQLLRELRELRTAVRQLQDKLRSDDQENT